MESTTLTNCNQSTSNQSGTIRLEKVNFFDRQLLTAEDMTTEREYFLQKLRRHNRFLHGWGVVCGLNVTASANASTPWRVQIGSGYALAPDGNEIFVGEAVYFDLSQCLTGSGTTNPCEPGTSMPGGAGVGTVAYLAIQYAECLARPVQVPSAGCGCNSDPCQYSRIRDSFQIGCLSQPPATSTAPPTLCDVVKGTIFPCPPCPTSTWVVLAKITLPGTSQTNITADAINTTVCRVLVSTAVLQDQVVNCCCGKITAQVDLQSIQVRPSNTTAVLPWGPSVTLTDFGNGTPYDYLITPTAPAPSGAQVITVSSSNTAITSPSSPVTVPAGQNTLTVTEVQAHFIAGVNDAATLTATGIVNTASATVIVQTQVIP